jgi:hypothetical protein
VGGWGGGAGAAEGDAGATVGGGYGWGRGGAVGPTALGSTEGQAGGGKGGRLARARCDVASTNNAQGIWLQTGGWSQTESRSWAQHCLSVYS